jgi:tetratricopeptide (TPR) repeat protein
MDDALAAIVSLVQGNRLAAARKACSSYLKKNRNSADAWFVHAGIHSCLNDLDQVISSCRRALAIQPAHTAAAFNLGVALQTRGREQEAIDAYAACLSHDPGHQAAQTNLAAACNRLCIQQLQAGNLPAAEAMAREALRVKPDSLEACNSLGLVANARQDLQQAEQHFKAALKIRADHSQSLNNLGSLYVSMNRGPEGIEMFKKAIAADPGYAEAFNNMGLAWQRCSDAEQSLDAFTRALRINPGNAAYHNNIGNTYLSMNDTELAIQHFRKAVELEPAYAEALNNLGNALLMTEDHREKYDEAEDCYRRAIAVNPGLAEGHFNLATCLQPQARYEEALEYYQKAIDLNAAYEDAIAGKTMVLEHLGRFGEAYATVCPLIDDNTTNINVALGFGKVAGRFDRTGEAIALLEHIIDNNLDPRNHSEAHFLAGKLCDAKGEYDKAFRHFLAANTIDAPEYNHDETISFHSELQTTFTRERQATCLHATNHSDLPVFIVGMPRSGTSLIEQILSSHPQVCGAGELEDIGNIATGFSQRLKTAMPYPRCIDFADQETLNDIADTYLQKLKQLGGAAQRVTDKMPHNFQALGMIERLFPGARVIHCRRDPVDTCLSIYFQHFNAYHAYSCDLENLATYYRQYLELMEHWKGNLSLPLLEISYETLVNYQEETSRTMIDFIGLDWDDACLRFHTSERIVTTPSYDQVRRPMYRGSLQRWKHYEHHLDRLISNLNSTENADGQGRSGST